jgi:hypothetical protein
MRMVEVPVERRPRHVPRCVMIHPYVELMTLAFLEARADAHRCAPEQLASYILDQVRADPQLQRLLRL